MNEETEWILLFGWLRPKNPNGGSHVMQEHIHGKITRVYCISCGGTWFNGDPDWQCPLTDCNIEYHAYDVCNCERRNLKDQRTHIIGRMTHSDCVVYNTHCCSHCNYVFRG